MYCFRENSNFPFSNQKIITLVFVGKFKNMLLTKHGELYFILASTCFSQSTRHFGECLSK
jgi:hypothetical protein